MKYASKLEKAAVMTIAVASFAAAAWLAETIRPRLEDYVFTTDSNPPVAYVIKDRRLYQADDMSNPVDDKIIEAAIYRVARYDLFVRTDPFKWGVDPFDKESPEVRQLSTHIKYSRAK